MEANCRRVSQAVLVMFLICVSSALAQTPPGPVPSNFFGMHIMNHDNWPDVPISPLGKGTGVTWPCLEPSKGNFNWKRLDDFADQARAHGIGFLYSPTGVPPWAAADRSTCHSTPYCTSCSGMVANMQDWKDFMTALVTRYRGRIQFYELWNEPEVYFTGTIAQLVLLTRQEHDVVRSINPQAWILSPSTISYGYQYLDNYFAAGGTKDIEVVAMHAYPKPGNAPEFILRSVTSTIKQVMRKYGLSAKQLWDTESSWGSASRGAITDPDERAAFIARNYLLHWNIGIKRAIWYGWDHNDIGTLWSPQGGDSEAAVALERVQKWMTGATMSACSLNGSTDEYHALYTCDLKRSGTSWVGRVVWWTDGSKKYTAPSQFTQYEVVENSTITTIPSDHQVPIGHKPILLENEDIP